MAHDEEAIADPSRVHLTCKVWWETLLTDLPHLHHLVTRQR